MMRSFAIALTTVAALVVAANLQAQGPGRGRGMGMGMGMGGGMTMLLQNEKVQKEIDLTAEQKEKLQALNKELADERTANRESMRDLSQEERMAKMRENAEKAQKKVEAILLPHQVERVKQIQLQLQLQTMPGMAIASADMVKGLGLTEDQQSKIKSINEESFRAMRDMFSGGFRDMSDEERTAAREKMEKSTKETETKLMDVLTAEQKEKLEKMKGEKFDTSSLTRGPGGGRRGNRNN